MDAHTKAKATRKQGRNGGRLRVLLVDDEPTILRILRRRLRDCEVVTAESAEDGIVLLDAMPFDIVVSDNSMPGRSGLELLAYAAMHHPQVRRVMHSGSRPAVIDSSIVQHFVDKPGHEEVAALVLAGATQDP